MTLMIHMYHECISIWENPLNGEKLIFNDWAKYLLACIVKEGIFKDTGSLYLENHDLNPSEYIEITSRSIFQNTINIIVEGKI